MNPIQRVIKHHHVRTEAAAIPTAKPARPPAGRDRPPPGARLVQVEGRLQAIEVTCPCGEVLVIDVEYESDPAEAVP